MKSRKSIATFAPHEIQQFVLPSTLAIVCLILFVVIEHLLVDPQINYFVLAYGILIVIYSFINVSLILRINNYSETFGLANAIISGIGLGIFTYIVPQRFDEASHILISLGIVAVATVSGRFHAYVTMILTFAISTLITKPSIQGSDVLELATPYLISMVVAEAILRIKDKTQQHIHRLETINKISRQIMLSLETEQTISLLNATMQEALEADTYFVGIVKGDEIQLDLFYDEGEYFNGVRVPLEGTLSGWIIKNQRALFLPDLREEIQLEGVKNFVMGKEKTSLSWMGVPLMAANVTGVISLGSYKPNAFDSGDMELLSNLAQHVTLALDNTIRHAQVEEQARLDSLTDVYNHGYFLKKLAEQAQQASANNTLLSLIMLDIDYFKQYNDTYGHLVGDKILKSLCTVIKHHIKQIDMVGRWGGEEFIIALPGANGLEALKVAERIGQTMALLQVEDRLQRTVPVPTVSQGVAVFPTEADEIYQLIDLADRRLYMAKKRGRNQIEPNASHWEDLQTSQESTSNDAAPSAPTV
jgi:diguanylate cyclase (GGDEF)-like protein